MEKRNKIMIVGILPPSRGGITSMLVNILSSKLVEEFNFIPFNIGRPAKPNVNNNFGYSSILNSGFRRAFIAIYVTLWHILKLPIVLLKERPSLVHIHTAPYWVFWETAIYVLICKIAKIPCLLQMHFSFKFFFCDSTWILKKLILLILRWVNSFVVICTEDISFLKELGTYNSNVIYLPNYIDSKMIQSIIAEIKRTKVKDKNTSEILFLGGTDTIRKGLPELLLTVPYLISRFPNIRLRLVAVPEKQVHDFLSNEYRDHCLIDGWIVGRDKFERFANADIFVLPTHAEGMPMAILEAMAAGLPIVASKVGAIPDMVRNGIEGLLIPPKDIKSLVKAISYLLESNIHREQMGKLAAERVQKEYDFSIGVERIRQLYLKC
jgi:glycosyltransferase involved in cell wall biosynthesis